MNPKHVDPKHIAWFGSLLLGLAACSGDEGTDGPTVPPFSGGAVSAPSAGAGGQVGVVPPTTGLGGSTNESGIPVVGGIAGSGGSGAAAPGAAGDAGAPPVLPGTPDAGAVTPPPPDTVVDGPVGPGPSTLPPPPGAGDLPRPSGVAGDTVTILNWAGYTGAVTYSFDDNNNSVIQGYDTLNALGVPFTFYLWTNQPSASNAVWARALSNGHEIGNHTRSHDANNACNAGDIMAGAQDIQNNLGVQPLTMAAPEGRACFATAAQGLFFINRGVSPATPVMPNGNSDPLNLNCYIPNPNNLTFNNDVNGARTQGGWVIYVVHGFTGDGSAYMPFGLDQMTAAIQYTKSLGDMWIGTMVDVGSYWLGQKAFTQAMRTQNGDAFTWTWNLPGQFPPGKYIRARVPGGTLTQDGQPLTWDPHGYYEIALDARSVTLTP
jgi:polysaccharide deacetylase